MSVKVKDSTYSLLLRCVFGWTLGDKYLKAGPKVDLYKTRQRIFTAPPAVDSDGEVYGPQDPPQGYYYGDPDKGRVFPQLRGADLTLLEWCKHDERTAAMAALQKAGLNKVVCLSLLADDSGRDVITGDFSNFAMSRSPCLVCTLGTGLKKARMVAMFDTGATHTS